MKWFRCLALLVVPLFIVACGLSDQQQADYAAVQRAGVSEATYDKMLHGDPLSIADIENLSRAHVNNGIILRYIRDQGTIYTLNSNDVIQLRKAGVDQSVIDYMLETARGYDYYGPYGPYGYYDPFFYGPYGPFGFYDGFYGGFGFRGGYHGGGHGYHH